MDRILIRGGTPLTGTIPIGGAKNAALPLMAASLLTAEPLVLANLPDLADIRTMANLLGQDGEEQPHAGQEAAGHQRQGGVLTAEPLVLANLPDLDDRRAMA